MSLGYANASSGADSTFHGTVETPSATLIADSLFHAQPEDQLNKIRVSAVTLVNLTSK
jgi:hypothetical protein